MARPAEYTDEVASELCARIAEGNSLRKVCSMSDMPSTRTFYNWLAKHKLLVQQYARAKEDSADSRADQIEEIGDKVLNGEYDPAAARVAIDAFKWTSGKHKPKKYGDKQIIENTHSFNQMSDEELNNRLKALEDELKNQD